ncbi:type II toxin-antitoxin system Phd/YefM family antitoxin [Alloscardovia venturai]|uniref:Antitoxin n=1 Tax=Alloscardovia venturai TaxID=1769421 RepID=A0ABW2Y7T9_9BIFI
MHTVTVIVTRKDIYNLINEVNTENAPITITSTKGKSAVLIGEDDWEAIQETLYLMNVPRMSETLMKTRNEIRTDYLTDDELEW